MSPRLLLPVLLLAACTTKTLEGGGQTGGSVLDAVDADTDADADADADADGDTDADTDTDSGG